MTTIQCDGPVSVDEALAMAVKFCSEMGARLKESSDGAERARGAMISEMLPAFYVWLHQMQAGEVAQPGDVALAFGDTVGGMLVNIAVACCSSQHDVHHFMESLGAYVVRVAKTKHAEGPALMIKPTVCN